MKIEKSRTITQMAVLYGVSEQQLREQMKDYDKLNKALSNIHFKGEIFFPKHQATLFRFLGEPPA